MPMRGELKPVAVRSGARTSAAQRGWSVFIAIARHQDLQSILAFCTIGFLLTMNLVLRFPDFGAAMAELALFP